MIEDFPEGKDILQRTTELLAHGYGFDMIWAAESEEGGAVVRHLIGNRTDSFRGTLLRNGRGLAGAAHASGRVRWVEDYFGSSDITHDYDQSVAVEQISRAVAAPIVAGESVYGVLIGGHRTAGDVGARSLEILESAAQRCAEACYYAERVRAAMQDAVREQRRRTLSALDDAVEATIKSIDARLNDDAPLSRTEDSLRSRLRTIERHAFESTASLLGPAREMGVRRRSPTGGAITKREYEVLCRAAQGETNVEVALAMGLSANTVKSYLQSLMAKLGARNRLDAVMYAKELGLI